MKSGDDWFLAGNLWQTQAACCKAETWLLTTQVCYSQDCGLPSSQVGLWELGCREDRTPRNWRLQAVALGILLRVPWTAKISNQSILKAINPEYLLEGLIWRRKLQDFGHLKRIADSLGKSLMLVKMEGRRRRGHRRMRWLDGIADAVDMNVNKLLGMVRGREAWPACSPRCHKESDATGRLNNKGKFGGIGNWNIFWATDLNLYVPFCLILEH